MIPSHIGIITGIRKPRFADDDSYYIYIQACVGKGIAKIMCCVVRYIYNEKQRKVMRDNLQVTTVRKFTAIRKIVMSEIVI